MLEKGDKKKQMDKKLEKAHGQAQGYRAGVTPVGKKRQKTDKRHIYLPPRRGDVQL